MTYFEIRDLIYQVYGLQSLPVTYHVELPEAAHRRFQEHFSKTLSSLPNIKITDIEEIGVDMGTMQIMLPDGFLIKVKKGEALLLRKETTKTIKVS